MATRRVKPLLQLRVQGPGVRSGSITVPDLIRICRATQDAVTRQAEAMRGGRSLRSGPKSSVVYQECTLELTGIKKGSTVLPFVLAKNQQHLPSMTSFGHEVVREVASAVKTLGARKLGSDVRFEVGLLDSLRDMGEVLNKDVTKIEWIVPSNGKSAVKAVYDKRVRERVIEQIKLPTSRPETVEGMLEMADFRAQDHKCRILPPVGQPILCTFSSDQEDEIQGALRKPVRVKGIATINPNNGKIDSIEVKAVSIVDELSVGAKDFFIAKSLQQLAGAQGVSPISNPRALAGGWPEADDIDSFLEDVYSGRGA